MPVRRLLLICAFVVVAAGAHAPPAGQIATAAGNGRAGYRGDGGPARDAELNQPFHCELVRLRGEPFLLVAEAGNHCIRRVNLRTGVIETAAGCGRKGYEGDAGDARLACFQEPYAVVAEADGTAYVADRLNAVVRRIDGRTGVVTTFAGNGRKAFAGDGGPAADASLVEPNDLALDGRGGLLIADVADCRVRRVDLRTRVITTFAGVGKPPRRFDPKQRGDGGPASQALLLGARAVCVDGRGHTYVCEREGHCVRRVDPSGVITSVAGTGERGYAGDGGDARKAQLNGPKAVRCDAQGHLYIVDTENHAVRRVDAVTGRIATVAGGRRGPKGDGGDAAAAELDRPHGLAVERDGTLYIADSNNHRVRVVRWISPAAGRTP